MEGLVELVGGNPAPQVIKTYTQPVQWKTLSYTGTATNEAVILDNSLGVNPIEIVFYGYFTLAAQVGMQIMEGASILRTLSHFKSIDTLAQMADTHTALELDWVRTLGNMIGSDSLLALDHATTGGVYRVVLLPGNKITEATAAFATNLFIKMMYRNMTSIEFS